MEVAERETFLTLYASRDLWTRDATLELVPWLDALDEHAAGWPTGRGRLLVGSNGGELESRHFGL